MESALLKMFGRVLDVSYLDGTIFLWIYLSVGQHDPFGELLNVGIQQKRLRRRLSYYANVKHMRVPMIVVLFPNLIMILPCSLNKRIQSGDSMQNIHDTRLETKTPIFFMHVQINVRKLIIFWLSKTSKVFLFLALKRLLPSLMIISSLHSNLLFLIIDQLITVLTK